MTTDKELRAKAEKDIARLSKGHPKDRQGNIFDWNEKRRCFTRKDKAGNLWVKGINSTVAGYWANCDNESNLNQDGLPVTCNVPHFVFIFENGETKKCDGCGKDFKIKITVA